MTEQVTFTKGGIYYRQYNGESDLQYIMSLVQNELSEPYVIYTYRYFLQGWPNLSFLAFPEEAMNEPQETTPPIGVIVCKQSIHKGQARRGYIAMLSVDRAWRKKGIASTLVQLSMDMMIRTGADEIVLETEVDNVAALGLYASLGFIREKRLYRFYMNGKDAFRLVLPVLPSANNDNTSPTEEKEDPTSAPIAVPQPIHILSKSKIHPGVATLDTPPSPLYPIHGASSLHGGGSRDLSPERLSSSASTSFAMGGILGAAAPRSVDSNDSFHLYGSHIPSSISPPLPVRRTTSTSTGASTSVRDGEDHFYTSSR